MSAARHSADCAANPFEKIPGRVFLDTNIINLIVKWSEAIFENMPIPASVDGRTADDIEALRLIFWADKRAGWDLVASAKTIDEISQTFDERVRSALLSYSAEIAKFWTDEAAQGLGLARRLSSTSLLSALPDPSDRELIGNAIGMGCDVFCTRDHKTIVRKRHLLPPTCIRVLTPVEWWACIKPWAALWC